MKYIVAAALFILFTLPLIAGDWRQFRGPNASGVSNEKGLPTAWSNKTNIRWKATLPGRGVSNPVIAGGRIFVTASSGWQQKRLHVLCFEEATGKLLWERQFWATGASQCHPKTCMAAPTPVTDGENVYALFATHDLAALDKNGNLHWFRSLTDDYPTVGNNVGMASSPILWKDTLLLAVENAGESFALAIDTRTGKNRWRRPRQRGINWVTPLVIESGDKAQVLFQSPDELTAYDPATGKKLWKVTGQGFSTIPSPIFAEGKILTQGGKFLAIRPGNGKKKAEILWQSRKLRCGYASPLYYDGKVYALASRGVLRCADAVSGAPLWDMRVEGNFAASPVIADGKLYAVNESGATTVIDITGARAKPLSRNPIGEKILATPVIANGAIYLRSDKQLYCIKK